MKRTLISTLLATVALPLAAYAQTEPAQTEEPLVQTQEPAPTDDTTTAQEPAPTDDSTTTAQEPAPADDSTTTAQEPAPTDDATTAQEPAPADDATTTAQEPAPADDATTTAEQPAAEDGEATTQLAGEDDVEGPFVTVPMTGAWRVSDLEGKNVEDANGESIGDISDVLVNERGEVIAVLVGVGGFLGIGQKDVAVSMSALEFGPGKTEGLPTEEEVAQQAEMEAQTQAPATGTTGAVTGTAPAPAAPAAEQTQPVVGEDNLPDRIVLNVTREELEAAPAYEDVESGAAEGATGAAEPPAEPAQ